MDVFLREMSNDSSALPFIRYKKNQRRKFRREILNALVEANNSVDSKKKKGKGLSTKEIKKYINDKILRSLSQLTDINQKYEQGVISKSDKDELEEKVKSKFCIKERTIENHLKDFKKEGWVEKKGKEYFILEDFLKLTHQLSYSYSEEILDSIMKLHTPLYNTLEKNMSDLITLFGTYVIACILEASRPIDDKFFTVKKMKALTTEQKNEFTKIWLEKVINTRIMYKYFLETFLNQPPDKQVRDLIKVQFKELRNGVRIYTDENGIEYDNIKHHTADGLGCVTKNGEEILYKKAYLEKLKKVPIDTDPLLFSNSISLSRGSEFFYELDKTNFDKVREALEKSNPNISKQLNNTVSWSVGHGEKTNVLYSWISNTN